MKLIALCNFKNEEWILPIWLKRTSEFADEIIALDDGSTDNTYNLLISHPKVVKVIRNNPGRPFNVLKNRQKLLAEAKNRNADWVIHLDADEIMDIRLRDVKDELMSNNNVHRYFFKEITLWKNTEEYRTDRPEMYNRIHKGFAIMARVTPNIKWVFPYNRFLQYQYAFIKKNKRLSKKVSLWSTLKVENSNFVELHDIKKIHYHFVDWNKVIKTHMFYAVRKSIEEKTTLDEAFNIVKWATSRMNEDGLKLAPVKKEWGTLKL